MAASAIPVDLANPGQVFACLGFAEAADALLGEAAGAFEWESDRAGFQLEAAGDEAPVARVLRFLDEATVTSLAPPGSPNSTKRWGVDTVAASSNAFPFPDPEKPAKLPACLTDRDGYAIVIDHWGDTTCRRDEVKFWAGSGGYPGAALARDALELARLAGRAASHAADPFALHALQSSSFRFDWRRDYVPLDAGFSPNLHKEVVMRGYPIVELLAAVGLTHARPLRGASKLSYSYGVAGLSGTGLHDLNLLRAALGSRVPPCPGVPFRTFRMQLDWPGQQNQARCITSVIEESSSP